MESGVVEAVLTTGIEETAKRSKVGEVVPPSSQVRKRNTRIFGNPVHFHKDGVNCGNVNFRVEGEVQTNVRNALPNIV